MQDASGYVTDEELELRQTLEPSEVTSSTKQHSHKPPPPLSTLPNSIQVSMEATKAVTDAESSIVSATSPSKEVLIGGDNNPSRR